MEYIWGLTPRPSRERGKGGKRMKRAKLEKLFRIAFQKGENFGVTYSTWFEPTKEDREEAIQKAMEEAFDTTPDPERR